MKENTTPDFILRQSILKDCELMFRLQKLDGAIFNTSNEEQVLKFEEYKTTFKPEEIQVVEAEGISVGRLRVVRGDDLYIGGMQLLPEYRGKGIGTAILGDLIKESEETKRQIRLEVFKNNPKAQSLYERVGFELVG